jgi:hypothetical protein
MRTTVTERFVHTLIATAALVTLAACGGGGDAKKAAESTASADTAASARENADGGWSSHFSVSDGGISFDGDTVVLGKSAPKARISANGDLSIGDAPVTVDAAQRADLVAYHGTALQFRAHAVEVGKAGAQLGKDAVVDVFKGIASGDTSKIEENVKAKAEGVKAAAGRLCQDVRTLKDTQDRLAAGIPQFAPYATLVQGDVDDCLKDTAPDGVQVASDAPAQTPAEAHAAAAAAAAASAASAASSAPAAGGTAPTR